MIKKLIAQFPRTLQTLRINQTYTLLHEHEIEGLMHQLVALVKAKLDPINGAFAALKGICFRSLELYPKCDQLRRDEPNRPVPWMADLRRVCEEADVKLHDNEKGLFWMEEESLYDYFCNLCRRCETPLDSAPVIPEKEE